MSFEFKNLTVVDWVAVYGAVVSTLTAFGSVIAFFIAKPKIKIYGNFSKTQKADGEVNWFLCVYMENRGRMPVTIAAGQIQLRPSWWAAFPKAPSPYCIIPISDFDASHGVRLEANATWKKKIEVPLDKFVFRGPSDMIWSVSSGASSKELSVKMREPVY